MSHQQGKQKFRFEILSNAQFTDAFDLLKHAAEAMREAGLYQWDENYPPENAVRNAIVTGDTYGYFIEEQLAGLVTLDNSQDPLYEDVDWKLEGDRVGVIHRLAVSPNFQGQGLGKRIMELAHEEALKRDFDVLRLDAFSINPKIQKLYLELGYSACGEIFIYPERPAFTCFEKKL